MINITNVEQYIYFYYIFNNIKSEYQLILDRSDWMGTTCYNVQKPGHGIEPGQFQQNGNYHCEDINTSNKQNNFEANPQNADKYDKVKSNQKIKKKLKYHFQSKNMDCIALIEQQYNEMKRSYEQHYIDEAYQYAQSLQHLLALNKQKKNNFTLTEQQIHLLQRVKTQFKDVIYYQSEIERGGWDLKSDKNGIKISCRRQADGTVGCRIEALSDVPFEILISIMIQVDFYKDYTPFLEISRAEKQVARNCRIGYTLNHIPLFTKRESYFQGIGYSRLNHPSKELFLFTRSIHDKKHLQELLEFQPDVNPDYIQLDYKYFVVRYRPIKKNVGFIDIGMNIDAKMDFIPTWLMEKVAKDFGQKFFKNIVRISKNFKGSKWQKNVEKNPHLFLYFQKEVTNFLEKQNLA